MDAAAVLELLLRGAVLLSAASLAHLGLRRRSASLRHALWITAFGALLVLPWIERVAPRVEVALPSLELDAPDAAAPIAARAATDPVAGLAQAAPSPRIGRPELATLLAIAWAAGAAALLALHVVRRVALGFQASAGAPLDDERWSRQIALAGAAVGLRRPVRVVASDAVVVPLALGWRTPVILLPAAAVHWDDERIASVLRHELVHARRGDELTHALGVLARALHWPDPLAWLAFRALVRAREHSCDDHVLATGVRPSAYAAHLLRAASELPPRRSLVANATPALAGASECAERVRAVLDAGRARAPVGPRSFAMLLFTGAALVVPIAALQSEAGALAHAREIVALREHPLDDATLALLVAALEDDRFVEPGAIPIEPSALRQGGLPETTPGKEAARVLVRHGTRSIEALLGALEDGHPARREKAAWALGCIGERRTAGALAGLLARDASRDVRRITAWALGEMGARAERAALERALNDVATPVRAQAAHSLGDLRDARAVPALLDVIHDAAPSVRERAAHALGDIADASAAPALRTLLGDRDEGVRAMARWALREMGSEQR